MLLTKTPKTHHSTLLIAILIKFADETMRQFAK